MNDIFESSKGAKVIMHDIYIIGVFKNVIFKVRQREKQNTHVPVLQEPGAERQTDLYSSREAKWKRNGQAKNDREYIWTKLRKVCEEEEEEEEEGKVHKVKGIYNLAAPSCCM